jgi:hypothetical protein
MPTLTISRATPRRKSAAPCSCCSLIRSTNSRVELLRVTALLFHIG